ncbi:MAG: group I intron-associated PD-(D/E)XK endonuclease [Anaerolineae bacterium]
MVHNLHNKTKGALGEIAVAKELLAKGYQVFAELGDNSRVDLIVMGKDYRPIKIQVKGLQSKHGSVIVHVTKSGPNYRFRYADHHVDVFAIYVLDRDAIAYIPAETLLAQQKSLTLRIDAPENNQVEGVHWFVEFSEFERALRGHTQRTPAGHAEGEEMVQTATESSKSG